MHPNQNPEQELDDILLEFSSPSLEEILKEFSLPALQETEEAGEAEESEVPAAMEPLEADATAVFTPVQAESEPEDEAPAPVATAAPAQEKAEPFSDEWEPEYEEPMGEFTPKAPIPFPEKSRLRQLRQKLVAGPERRYQALAPVSMRTLGIITLSSTMAPDSMMQPLEMTLWQILP